jgi:hypothetical protein
MMPKQEELAFIKTITTIQLSAALLKKLRTALSRRKKESVVLAVSRSTASIGRARGSQRSSSQLAGKENACLPKEG